MKPKRKVDKEQLAKEAKLWDTRKLTPKDWVVVNPKDLVICTCGSSCRCNPRLEKR